MGTLKSRVWIEEPRERGLRLLVAAEAQIAVVARCARGKEEEEEEVVNMLPATRLLLQDEVRSRRTMMISDLRGWRGNCECVTSGINKMSVHR